jgi:hypothetical protein
MAQVQMQVYRGTSDYLDTISNVDGQFLYDEDTHQILLDNGTTREQYGGGNEKVYNTYAEAVADLANIAEGQTVFVKEGTSSDKPTITYAEWQQLSDIEKEAFSGYVSNFPEEQLNASAITYGNTNVGAELTSINTHLNDIAVHSTTEKAIGKWIDGKTIYRKTIYVSGSATNRQVLDSTLTLSYIDTLVSLKGTCLHRNTYKFSIPYGIGQNYVLLKVESDGLHIEFFTFEPTDVVVIIEYTK